MVLLFIFRLVFNFIFNSIKNRIFSATIAFPLKLLTSDFIDFVHREEQIHFKKNKKKFLELMKTRTDVGK